MQFRRNTISSSEPAQQWRKSPLIRYVRHHARTRMPRAGRSLPPGKPRRNRWGSMYHHDRTGYERAHSTEEIHMHQPATKPAPLFVAEYPAPVRPGWIHSCLPARQARGHIRRELHCHYPDLGAVGVRDEAVDAAGWRWLERSRVDGILVGIREEECFRTPDWTRIAILSRRWHRSSCCGASRWKSCRPRWWAARSSWRCSILGVPSSAVGGRGGDHTSTGKLRGRWVACSRSPSSQWLYQRLSMPLAPLRKARLLRFLEGRRWFWSPYICFTCCMNIRGRNTTTGKRLHGSLAYFQGAKFQGCQTARMHPTLECLHRASWGLREGMM